MGCGVIWFGTLKSTLARAEGQVRPIGCKKKRFWGLASSNRAREKFASVLPNRLGQAWPIDEQSRRLPKGDLTGSWHWLFA